jgi:hypothetical protein
MSSNTPLALIAPRVAFIDPRTGDISRQWFLLFAAIVDRLGGYDGLSNDDLALGVLSGGASPGLEEALQRITDALSSNPSVVPTFATPTVVDLEPTRVSYAPVDDVSPIVYVGTLGQQDANRATITGGTLDGTAIGATTASTGKFTTLTAGGGATLMVTSAALANGAAAAAGTLANAPVAGNPTKWIGINDNGTVRYIPAW